MVKNFERALNTGLKFIADINSGADNCLPSDNNNNNNNGRMVETKHGLNVNNDQLAVKFTAFVSHWVSQKKAPTF